MTYSPFSMTAARGALETSPSAFHVMALPVRPSTLRVGMTWMSASQMSVELMSAVQPAFSRAALTMYTPS